MVILKEWSEDQKLAVWNKGIIIPNYDPTRYRQDISGAWMDYYEYGNTKSDFGWEIDHIRPQAKGGSDFIFNLQPLQWKNNRSKGDDFPYCDFLVTSQGNVNITIPRRFKVA